MNRDYEERVFKHPLFGKLKVRREADWLYFPAKACAKKLLFLREGHTLLRAGAVCEYAFEGHRLIRGAEVELRDLWRLVFYCKGTWREGLAQRFYSWVYDEIYPEMFEE